MSTQLEHTQSYLLTHHGSDGQLAAQRTHDSHTRNHDESFFGISGLKKSCQPTGT
ncbi:MAG: hypothetical protein KC477_14225 [Oceanospirillaceae bacterium]|nr:hypothetical protein [Oceanospirillaceae bacterium]